MYCLASENCLIVWCFAPYPQYFSYIHSRPGKDEGDTECMHSKGWNTWSTWVILHVKTLKCLLNLIDNILRRKSFEYCNLRICYLKCILYLSKRTTLFYCKSKKMSLFSEKCSCFFFKLTVWKLDSQNLQRYCHLCFYIKFRDLVFRIRIMSHKISFRMA